MKGGWQAEDYEMNVYKTILNGVIEPLTKVDLALALEYANRLKGSEGNSSNVEYALGEVILRATNYIILSIELSKEQQIDK